MANTDNLADLAQSYRDRQATDAMMALRRLTTLWGYEVALEEVDAATNEVIKALIASPQS